MPKALLQSRHDVAHDWARLETGAGGEAFNRMLEAIGSFQKQPLELSHTITSQHLRRLCSGIFESSEEMSAYKSEPWTAL